MVVLHYPFSIKNMFYDKMKLRLFIFVWQFAQIYKPNYHRAILCDMSLHSWLKSSSRIISCNNFFGVLLTILETVLNKVDHSSLWKQMTMEAFKLMIAWFGSSAIHLKMNMNDFKCIISQNLESYFCIIISRIISWI